MSRKQLSGHCPVCGGEALYEKPRVVDHRMHLVFTVLSVGLWGLVWLALAIRDSGRPYLCTTCGTPAAGPLEPAPATPAASVPPTAPSESRNPVRRLADAMQVPTWALVFSSAVVLILSIAAIASLTDGARDEVTGSVGSEPAPTVPASEPAETKPLVKLEIDRPEDGSRVRGDTVTVSGTVKPRHKSKVIVAEVEASVAAGKWSVDVPLPEHGENVLTVVGSAPGWVRISIDLEVERLKTAEERAAEEAERAAKRAAEEAEYRAAATTIPYNQLEKNPYNHAGERVVYRGQIFQIQESFGTSVILLSVTDEGYGLWDDIVWVDYDGEIESAEDDIITVYGKVTGSKSYETQIGGETYVPRIRARYIDE